MCGGGSRGPSSQELVAQEEAAANRARAEADRIKAEEKAEKDAADRKALADSVATAKNDQDRRTRQRTLLTGIAREEGEDLLDDEETPGGRRKRRTLVGE